jgi:hypothetical protein
MADPVVLDAPLVWLGGYDLTTDLYDVTIKAGRVEVADPRFGNLLGASYPGIQQADAMVNGVFNPAVGGADAVAGPRVVGSFTADYSEWPLTVCPPLAPTAAAGADGNVAYTLRTAQFGIKLGAEHGQLFPFYLTSRARTGHLSRDTVLLPKATRVATATGTAYQLGAVVSGTNKIVAKLHVFSVTGGGGSVTVTIESDTVGFPSPIVRGTFNAVATAASVGRQVLEITSTITDDYWRAVATWTPGTNFSLAVVAALESA